MELWLLVRGAFSDGVEFHHQSLPTSHNLHAAMHWLQLVTMIAYYLLLVYTSKRAANAPQSTGWRYVALMGPLGFLTKQSLLSLARLLSPDFLAVWERRSDGDAKRRLAVGNAPRLFCNGRRRSALRCNDRRLLCTIWGQSFWYWIFVEMNTHPNFAPGEAFSTSYGLVGLLRRRVWLVEWFLLRKQKGACIDRRLANVVGAPYAGMLHQRDRMDVEPHWPGLSDRGGMVSDRLDPRLEDSAYDRTNLRTSRRICRVG